jgi:hypothetical protein
MACRGISCWCCLERSTIWYVACRNCAAHHLPLGTNFIHADVRTRPLKPCPFGLLFGRSSKSLAFSPRSPAHGRYRYRVQQRASQRRPKDNLADEKRTYVGACQRYDLPSRYSWIGGKSRRQGAQQVKGSDEEYGRGGGSCGDLAQEYRSGSCYAAKEYREIHWRIP